MNKILRVTAGSKGDSGKSMEVLDEERLDLRATNPCIVRGKFFYSQKQFSWQRRNSLNPKANETVIRPRMYCQLDSGEVREYTEMIDLSMLRDNLRERALCEDMFDDVIVLGYGYFHHYGEDVI